MKSRRDVRMYRLSLSDPSDPGCIADDTMRPRRRKASVAGSRALELAVELVGARQVRGHRLRRPGRRPPRRSARRSPCARRWSGPPPRAGAPARYGTRPAIRRSPGSGRRRSRCPKSPRSRGGTPCPSAGTRPSGPARPTARRRRLVLLEAQRPGGRGRPGSPARRRSAPCPPRRTPAPPSAARARSPRSPADAWPNGPPGRSWCGRWARRSGRARRG